MSKTKIFAPLLALMLCLGAFAFPVTAFAKTNEDTSPPTVTAVISGETLNITAKDDTGVAAVYINGQRFSTLANGTASVYLKDYAGTGAKIEVYATDTAGNRSAAVTLDNPYYQAPTSTPTPTTSSQAPASSSTPQTPPATSTPPAASTPAPSDSASDGSDASPDSSGGGTGAQSGIGTGDSVTTPQGTGTVTEVATDEDGKLFYTIETPAGNVFYLVIDMARTDGNNVYFLNSVTENDLLALAEMNGSTTGGESAIPTPDPEPEPTPEPSPEPETEEEPEDKGGVGMGSIIFIVLAAAAVGGAGYYFKILKPRRQAAAQDDEEYEEGEFDDYDDEGDAEYHFADDEDGYLDDGAGEREKEPFDNV